jgi:VanZ family protein
MDRRRWIAASLGLTALGEAVTVAARFGGGVSAREFNRTAPLLLQIHHMFWALPLGAAAFVLRRRPRVAGWLAAIAVACVASDLAHHFVVLPLLAGETGWHWP